MGDERTTRRVAEMVVAVLCGGDVAAQSEKLSTIKAREWKRSYHWLDANGLALYFLNVLKLNGLEAHIPREVLTRLEQNARDNQARLAHQFEEFRRVNECLSASGIPYVNVKGFTLSPEFCPDLSLRYQFDLDILIRRADADEASSAVQKLGYKLTLADQDELEFRADEDRLPKIAELYKPRRQRALEVHFASPTAKLDLGEDCLERAVLQERNGLTFPVLHVADQFLAQAFHLYRHLLGEWVRLSWFYELEYFLRSHASDIAFWNEISNRAAADRNTAAALAVVSAFAREAFSSEIPRSLNDLEASQLSASARLWIREYARSVLLSDFPGTKLYLLLLRELVTDQQSWNQLSRKRLLPFRVPPRVLHSNASRPSLRQVTAHISYALWRGRFHLREGARYVAEQRRWRARVQHEGLAG